MTIRNYALLLALFVGIGTAAAQDNPDALARQMQLDAEAQVTLDELFAGTQGAERLFSEAAGYAVFSATKAGFLVTGGGGTGVAVNKETGDRTYMRMGTGGIGLGLGAQRYKLVILFEDQAYLNRFIEGGWDASASAHAAAGSDGITLTSSFVDGIAFYQLTNKGLMAQADVSGTRFWVISDLNQEGGETASD